ncbi:hypothetical protein Bbelb_317150 [Branchiostoma belcheri]|nr:hypothetical protein Bbelb_317150 [Branchiostoma belcheri]
MPGRDLAAAVTPIPGKKLSQLAGVSHHQQRSATVVLLPFQLRPGSEYLPRDENFTSMIHATRMRQPESYWGSRADAAARTPNPMYGSNADATRMRQLRSYWRSLANSIAKIFNPLYASSSTDPPTDQPQTDYQARANDDENTPDATYATIADPPTDQPQTDYQSRANDDENTPDATYASIPTRVIGLWTRVTCRKSKVIVLAVGCGIVVAAIILGTYLHFLTAFFDDNHAASLEWLEPFANISLNFKTLPVTVTSLPTTDLNECTWKPCLHGRCVNKDGGYICICNPGWTGQNCQQAKPCPMGWSGYKNHCYKLMKDKAPWIETKKQCGRLGANLASITSSGEANFINGIITGGKWGVHLVWFGLHRNDEFRKFTDGSQVFYTNWEPGQPNNKGNIFTGNVGQDCVGIYSKTRMTKWSGLGKYLFSGKTVEIHQDQARREKKEGEEAESAGKWNRGTSHYMCHRSMKTGNCIVLQGTS